MEKNVSENNHKNETKMKNDIVNKQNNSYKIKFIKQQ